MYTTIEKLSDVDAAFCRVHMYMIRPAPSSVVTLSLNVFQKLVRGQKAACRPVYM